MAEARRQILRLGTRGSQLARMQSQMIADLIEATHPDVAVELVIVKTTGDQVQDRPLHEIGGKGLFTKELEQALLRSEVDFAVHSYKDVPVTQPLVPQADLVIGAVPAREDPRDVLVCETCDSVDALPQGARVGTSSLRRQCQLLALRPDLQIAPLRGNIDSRIRKLQEKKYDAVILALAGVRRAGLFDSAFMYPIDDQLLTPAAAQGALALQCRAADAVTLRLLAAIDDPTTRLCVDAERELVALLQGDCHSPIAALVTENAGELRMRTAVGAHGGQLPVLRATADRPRAAAHDMVAAAFADLDRQGARRLLHPA